MSVNLKQFLNLDNNAFEVCVYVRKANFAKVVDNFTSFAVFFVRIISNKISICSR